MCSNKKTEFIKYVLKINYIKLIHTKYGSFIYLLSVTGATFNGLTSYISTIVNLSQVAFGDSGEFDIRTRKDQGRLVYIQLHDKQGKPFIILEFLVFQQRLQMFTSVNGTGM